METTAPPLAEAWPPPLVWLREFLTQELAPYPGRLALVARMVLAATVVMLIALTFRLPFADYAAFYTLIISREDPQATIKAVETNVFAFAFSVIFVLVGAMLFAGDPMLRLLWVVGALFTLFFALSTLTNHTAAVRFGWLVVVTLPLWDEHTTADTKVEGTLWVVGAVSLASLVTAAIELTFTALRPSRHLLRSLDERLTAVATVLAGYAAGRPPDQQTASLVTSLGLLGTSRLRRVLNHSAASLHYGEQMGAVVALVGRMVDLTGSLVTLNPQFSPADRRRIQTLATNLATVRADLLAERVPGPVTSAAGVPAHAVPLLGELEQTVRMIPEAFTGSPAPGTDAPLPPGDTPSVRLLVPDAFTNPEHLKFALKGCLAASLCYLIYMAVDWPAISTAVTTCFLTAQSTIGASRQKQVLRITGALAGGILGVVAQTCILPSVDSIAGFTVLFLVVSFAAAWFITSGPRLSYFGVQLGFAFFLINLSGPTIQTSLTFGRDRVVGILLGLAIMWLVYDQLWGAPAGVALKRAFISVLRALAALAREPLSGKPRAAVAKSFALRETANGRFNEVRSLADAVWFEFGPAREHDLQLRQQILARQPALRMLFINCVALLKYRLRLPGFELPAPVRLAQQEFEECLARTLDDLADRLPGNARAMPDGLEAALTRLKHSVRISSSTAAPGVPAANLETLLSLSERITDLAISLDKEIPN